MTDPAVEVTSGSFAAFLERFKARHEDWFKSAPAEPKKPDHQMNAAGEELWDGYEEDNGNA